MSETGIARAPSLVEQVRVLLHDRIASGSIAPGQRIVVDRLSSELGVSHTPVREALAHLRQEGLAVDDGTGRLQVVPLTPAYVRNTFLVRGALEGLAAEFVAPDVTDTFVRDLQEAERQVQIAATDGGYDPVEFNRRDSAFHQLIYEHSDNQILIRELSGFQTHIEYIRGYALRRAGEHIRQSQAEHSRIVEALAGRDSVAARQAMEDHIRRAGDRIVEMLGEVERDD